MPDVHARLSASGAKRWMSCPPSVRLEEDFPDKGSEYAAEGTYAHSVAELILRYNHDELTKKTFTTRMNKLKESGFYSKELEEYVTDYVQRVWEIFNQAKANCPDAMILFEQRLDFSDYVPEGFGTGDVVIIADDCVEVIDLKYGKGVGVSAIDNPQLRLYGIGAYLEHSILYDIQRVRMTIIQPRLENISTEELTVDALLIWAEDEVRPKARQAAAGEGEFKTGDHCRFCKARATCRARAEHNMELAQMDFTDPDLLSDEEIGEVLVRADELAAWVKDVVDYAFGQAMEGNKIPGWKLVEGRSNRKYADADAVRNVLLDAGYAADQILKPEELRGITDITKLLGKKKFEDLLASQIIKPEGKPVLVSEADKRPELNSAASAADDFVDEESDEYYNCMQELAVLEAIPPHKPVEHYIESLGGKYSEEVIRKAYKGTVK